MMPLRQSGEEDIVGPPEGLEGLQGGLPICCMLRCLCLKQVLTWYRVTSLMELYHWNTHQRSRRSCNVRA